MLFLKQEIALLITYNPTYHLTFELFYHRLRPDDRERWSLIALSPPPTILRQSHLKGGFCHF